MAGFLSTMHALSREGIDLSLAIMEVWICVSKNYLTRRWTMKRIVVLFPILSICEG
jgi:hypothetical protein